MEKFTENSLKERDALRKSNILNIFKDGMYKKGYDIANQMITPYTDYDSYDALQIYTKFENQKTEYLRILIEVKVRSEVYDEMFLETKKWEQLNNIRKSIHGNFKLLYINYTNKGTYVFDITDVSKYTLTKRLMSEYTSKKSEKVMKPVYLLPIEKAKFIPFIYDDKDFNPNYNQELKQVAEHKKLYDIFGQIIEIDKATKIYESKSKNIAKINIKSDKSYFEFNQEQEQNFKEIEEFMGKKKL
jgi:hypothetical protein